jgi:hypothetical protein
MITFNDLYQSESSPQERYSYSDEANTGRPDGLALGLPPFRVPISTTVLSNTKKSIILCFNPFIVQEKISFYNHTLTLITKLQTEGFDIYTVWQDEGYVLKSINHDLRISMTSDSRRLITGKAKKIRTLFANNAELPNPNHVFMLDISSTIAIGRFFGLFMEFPQHMPPEQALPLASFPEQDYQVGNV